MKGIDELKTIVFTVMEFQKKEKSYQIKEVYEKVKDENSNAIATTKDILKILK